MRCDGCLRNDDMSNTYTAAVIGVGSALADRGSKTGGGFRIGYTHGNMYRRSPRVDLVAAADINAENLHAFRERFSVARGFADHREMLESVKPDLVSIATYVGLHRAMIEDCVAAGVKGIVCEKPFLASPADCAAVRALLAKSKTKLIVAHPRRYRP